jgi:Arylsulfotransferase (ASST)/Secretion system C-terminal sorting domain
MKKLALFISILLQIKMSAQATLGLLQFGNGELPGYVLFSPTASTTTYLIDKCGYEVKQWLSSYNPGQGVYLDNSGNLVRAANLNNSAFNAGGKGGRIERFNWTSGLIDWTYTISTNTQLQHHDICVMPNGNVLVIVWEKMTVAQATAQGRNPSLLANTLWVDRIMELQPVGLSSANVVWEWSVWDHLIQDFDSTKPNYGVVADHPELFNLNFVPAVQADWMHMNGIAYNANLDQIVFSSRLFSEVFIIDHSTSTAEAATHSGGNSGKGGDILYRWGNPQAYDRGTATDRQFYFQHCPVWIPNSFTDAGKLMVFNNGTNRPGGNFSSVDVIDLPVDSIGNYFINAGQPFGPQSPFWSYADTANFYAGIVSGAYRLSNGNTFITEGSSGLFFEIDSAKNVVWKYQNPVNQSGPNSQGSIIPGTGVFKAQFYEPSFVGFTGKTLTPGNPIELNPLNYNCSITTGGISAGNSENSWVFPNPAKEKLTLRIGDSGFQNYFISDALGKEIISGTIDSQEVELNFEKVQAGIYFVRLFGNGKSSTKKIIIEQK